MDVVKTEIDEVLDYKGMKDTGKHPIDKTGKSKFTRIYYKLSNGSAEIVCYDMSKKLEKKGFYVVPIRPPSVPPNSSRLRISITSSHSQNNIKKLFKFLKMFKNEM